MRKKNIFLLVGECATGKTSVEVKLAQKYNRVVSYTTRPKRSNEVDGVDYNFVNDQTFDNLAAKGEFLEQTQYTVSGRLFRYALPRSGFKDDVPNIVVVNPHGAFEILQDSVFKENSIILLFKSKLQTRIDRYIERETGEEKYSNLVQRLKQDAIDFEKFESELDKEKIDYLPIWNEGICLGTFIKHIDKLINLFAEEGK